MSITTPPSDQMPPLGAPHIFWKKMWGNPDLLMGGEYCRLHLDPSRAMTLKLILLQAEDGEGKE